MKLIIDYLEGEKKELSGVFKNGKQDASFFAVPLLRMVVKKSF